MSLFFRFDAATDGATNMAADELLAEGLPDGGVAVRFYGWQETTLSLGAFQRFDDLAAFPELSGLPLVRRPSGGGAILHGTDLTYAIAVSRSHPWGATAQGLYDAVHGAMVDLLRRMSLGAQLVAGGLPAADADREPYLCFDRRSPGDVVVGQHKVLGSAQRRHRAAVVQHGSLLLRQPLLGPVPEGVSRGIHQPGIENLLERGVDLQSLCRDWLALVARAAGLEPRPETRAVGAALGEAWQAAVGRYRDDGWTRRR